MTMTRKFVIDTNALISALLFKLSVLLLFLIKFINSCQLVKITETITICRDKKYNNFLELAVSGNANLIITGDLDLLVLNPFQSIEILTPDSSNRCSGCPPRLSTIVWRGCKLNQPSLTNRLINSSLVVFSVAKISTKRASVSGSSCMFSMNPSDL